MSVRNQALFWLAVFITTIVFILVFQKILMPFILGLVLGYLLDPTTDKLEAARIPRGFAAFIVLCGFFMVIVLVFALLIPILQSQIIRMAEVMPAYLQDARFYLVDMIETYVAPYADLDFLTQENLNEKYGDRAIEWSTGALKGIWSGGQAIFSLVTLLIITPVVAFYMLRDWDKMTAHIDHYIPMRHRETVHKVLNDIDASLSGFLRGQGIVCLILAIYYATGLSLTGLESGLLIGVFIGIISFVPYIGAILGGVLCIGMALLQFDGYTMPLVVAAIFGIGQFLEGSILAPRFVGGNVNLHPVWILFALLAGGTLFGFTGVLLAMPIAAVIGVLARYLLAEYKKTSIYQTKKKSSTSKRVKNKK